MLKKIGRVKPERASNVLVPIKKPPPMANSCIKSSIVINLTLL